MNPPVYPVVYNLDQVAERFGVPRKRLLEWLWKHPCDANGVPFYRSMGRLKLFTETDVARIFASLPTPQPLPRLLPQSRGRGALFTPRRETSAYERVQAMLGPKKTRSKKRTRPGERGTPNVAPVAKSSYEQLEALLVSSAKAPPEEPARECPAAENSPAGSSQNACKTPADARRGSKAARIPIYPGREKAPRQAVARGTAKSPAADGE